MCQGLMSPSTMAEAGPIISFSHCLFYDRKGIEGLMCSLLAGFLTHAPMHKFYKVEILGWPPLRWRVVCQGIVSVWGNIHRGF